MRSRVEGESAVQAAARPLRSYGWGKPPETVASDGYDPLEVDALTAEAAAIVDEIAAR